MKKVWELPLGTAMLRVGRAVKELLRRDGLGVETRLAASPAGA